MGAFQNQVSLVFSLLVLFFYDGLMAIWYDVVKTE